VKMLEKRRRSRKMTQRAVAEAVGISLNRYRRLEWGMSIHNESEVRARVDQFFDGTEGV
jgi:hypothetical protein